MTLTWKPTPYLRVTRLGCLAAHLMPEYHGRKLANAVKRIAANGPRTAWELSAVRRANADDCGDEPLIPEVPPCPLN